MCDIATGNKNTQDKSDDGIYPFYVRSQTVERINSWSFDGEAILTAGDGVGVGKVFHYSTGKIGVHQRVYILSNFTCDSKYLFHYFSSRFYARVKRMSAKNSVDSVRMEMIADMPIYLASKDEQIKIGNLLSLLDERIETQKKIIEDLKRLKYAISKRVFTEMGQLHPVVKLGQLCSIKTGKLDANAMKDNGNFPFFTCAREDYRTDTYAFEGDSLLISGNGDIGIVKRYNGKFNAYQRTYVLQDFIQDIAYVQCFVEYHLPKRVLKEKNVGAMPYIVLSTLSEMPIILPPTCIQSAICKTIGAISEQINVEENILANFEFQKQYNLSMMFI